MTVNRPGMTLQTYVYDPAILNNCEVLEEAKVQAISPINGLKRVSGRSRLFS